jgi:hypothetical protein
VDAEDQLIGAEWLIKQGLALPEHIGLYSWNYGGFLSAMCLARFPEIFCCAVAGAPVTAWDGYDTFYTEKYMGLPSENKDAYEFGSIMHHVNNVKGNLLLIHCMIDENVHFRHTTRLVNSLIASNQMKGICREGHRIAFIWRRGKKIAACSWRIFVLFCPFFKENLRNDPAKTFFLWRSYREVPIHIAQLDSMV